MWIVNLTYGYGSGQQLQRQEVHLLKNYIFIFFGCISASVARKVITDFKKNIQHLKRFVFAASELNIPSIQTPILPTTNIYIYIGTNVTTIFSLFSLQNNCLKTIFLND